MALKLREIRHPECEKTAFYAYSIPIGRDFMAIDALDKEGNPHALGNRVECLNCGKKVDLEAVSAYYNE